MALDRHCRCRVSLCHFSPSIGRTSSLCFIKRRRGTVPLYLEYKRSVYRSRSLRRAFDLVSQAVQPPGQADGSHVKRQLFCVHHSYIPCHWSSVRNNRVYYAGVYQVCSCDGLWCDNLLFNKPSGQNASIYKEDPLINGNRERGQVDTCDIACCLPLPERLSRFFMHRMKICHPPALKPVDESPGIRHNYII